MQPSLSEEMLNEVSVFSNMYSLLNQSIGDWPLCLILPDIWRPKIIETEPLTNIFTQVVKKECSKVTACPHSERKHYAKNMCNNCYHRFGRDKIAWACSHIDRKHYAKGKCQFCYLKHYNNSRPKIELKN